MSFLRLTLYTTVLLQRNDKITVRSSTILQNAIQLDVVAPLVQAVLDFLGLAL